MAECRASRDWRLLNDFRSLLHRWVLAATGAIDEPDLTRAWRDGGTDFLERSRALASQDTDPAWIRSAAEATEEWVRSAIEFRESPGSIQAASMRDCALRADRETHSGNPGLLRTLSVELLVEAKCYDDAAAILSELMLELDLNNSIGCEVVIHPFYACLQMPEIVGRMDEEAIKRAHTASEHILVPEVRADMRAFISGYLGS